MYTHIYTDNNILYHITYVYVGARRSQLGPTTLPQAATTVSSRNIASIYLSLYTYIYIYKSLSLYISLSLSIYIYI